MIIVGYHLLVVCRESVKIVRDELITVNAEPVNDNDENILTITSSVS